MVGTFFLTTEVKVVGSSHEKIALKKIVVPIFFYQGHVPWGNDVFHVISMLQGWTRPVLKLEHAYVYLVDFLVQLQKLNRGNLATIIIRMLIHR